MTDSKEHPDGCPRRALAEIELDHILTGLSLFEDMLSSGSDEDKALKRELRTLGRRLKRGHVTLDFKEDA